MGDSDQDWKRWILGIVIPLFAAFDGVKGLISKTASLDSHQAHYEVVGQEAFAVSCGCLAAAICLHVYFFWENRERLAGYREVVFIVGMLCFLVSAGRFVYLDFRP